MNAVASGGEASATISWCRPSRASCSSSKTVSITRSFLAAPSMPIWRVAARVGAIVDFSLVREGRRPPLTDGEAKPEQQPAA